MSYGTPPPPNQPPPTGSGGWGASGYGGQTPPGYPGYQPTRQTNTMAIISLVLGLLGLTGMCLLTGIPALILGYRARREIRDAAGSQDGEGLATAGIVLGWVTTLISVLAIAAFVAILAFGIAASDSIEPTCNNIDEFSYNDC